ncbi:hypothetical protein JX68_02950 [Listeria monocytogenes]|nr:hypothetical protein [Listeria monocytogenes]EAD1364937.1 hypothetical protein [Listeria monocytogenes]EAD1374278.1 hypothetical protein [Listeria monocytogenes]EAE8372659.1 hypothetical protein [Listeria monocytogenes]EAG6442725.1 hypothetical protein [Listeria monocytogenes]
MAHLITTAIPTDEVAISFLKSNQVKYPSIDITPFVAKELYNIYIFSKRHFICPTDGCDAPVTCRSIDPSSKNKPTFVNQSLSTNKHSSNCPYHPNNYLSVVTNEAPSGESFKYLNSGEIISDLSLVMGSNHWIILQLQEHQVRLYSHRLLQKNRKKQHLQTVLKKKKSKKSLKIFRESR